MPINYNVKGQKRPNTVINFTEEMVKEYAKCSRDIFYFAETYYTIVDEKKGKHIIELFDYQKTMLNMFVNNQMAICATGRQLGKCVHSQQIVEIMDTNSKKTQKIQISQLLNCIKNNINPFSILV